MKDLPVKKTEEFLAEVEVMDLSKLKDGSFVVMVGTGDPESFNILASTIHGPFSFVEMLQEVGDMWASYQHHAKVIKLDKNVTNATQMLDPNTVDYIECHYNDLITEEMLTGAFDAEKEYTCQSGFMADDGADPRKTKKEEPSIEDEDSL